MESVELWFNHEGYYIKYPRGEARYLYDLPHAVDEDATAKYLSRWMILNDALDQIKELSQEAKILKIFTDSRLLEELSGEIEPTNHFAKSSLRHYIMYDSIEYRQIDYKKVSSASLKDRIKNGESKTSST